VFNKLSNNEAVVDLTRKNTDNNNKLVALLTRITAICMYYIQKIFKQNFETTNSILHSENKTTKIDLEYINNSDYDLVHLHWINYDTISIEDIAKIKKPIVWTIHDSWLFCGAEHYQNIIENDTRFIAGYLRCNRPATTKGIDICRKTYLRKSKSWRNKNFTVISPSNFERDCYVRSALFLNRGTNCAVIPNVLPKNIFRPLNKQALRKLYNVPLDKKVIGFGAVQVSKEKTVKGGWLLLEALRKIANPNDFYFVVFGRMDETFVKECPMCSFVTGYVENEYILAAIYNLCDIFVCPSIIENLPNTCLEALFCGIPIAAFATGGIPDIVKHKETGYLAKPFDADDLYQGILYCLDDQRKLSKNSMSRARKTFDNEVIVRKHVDLYKQVLLSNNT
jgi:glycosyltransferase involved in cell wall biosynthesis